MELERDGKRGKHRQRRGEMGRGMDKWKERRDNGMDVAKWRKRYRQRNKQRSSKR